MNDVEYNLQLQDRKKAAKNSMKSCFEMMNGNIQVSTNIVGAAKNVVLPGDEYEKEKARLAFLASQK
jgi:hypothetical protein